MKILLILTLLLISGPVQGFEVIGYPGGNVIINLSHHHSETTAVFFCKIENVCEYLITASAEQKNQWIHKGRFSLIDNQGSFWLIFRELSLQDEGQYLIRWANVRDYEMTLIMKSDPCCTQPKTIRARLGETVMITCKYPALLEKHTKTFYKLEAESIPSMSYIKFSEVPRDSISVDRQAKALRVNISDVREADEGMYFCAVVNFSNPVHYYSSFKEIHLRVTEETETEYTTWTPAATRVTPQSGSSNTELLIIIVCICVTLLLLGGFALKYKLRRLQTQVSTSATNNMIAGDYENDPPRNQMSMAPVYQNLNANDNQPESVYQSLDPNNQSDSVYQSLDPNNQSDSVYQSLDPNTNQSDAVYLSLNFNTNQVDCGIRLPQS